MWFAREIKKTYHNSRHAGRGNISCDAEIRGFFILTMATWESCKKVCNISLISREILVGLQVSLELLDADSPLQVDKVPLQPPLCAEMYRLTSFSLPAQSRPATSP